MNDEYRIDPRTRNVNSVIFGVLSPEKIREQSVCKIDKYLSNIKESSNDYGSVVDPRMGITSKNGLCATCNLGYDLCPGHFGHIDLALPIYNLMYMPVLLKVLKCTCIKCGSILLNKNDIDYENELKKTLQLNPKNRLNYLASLTRATKPCTICGHYQPKYTLFKKESIYISMLPYDPESKEYLPENQAIKLNAFQLWNLLNRLSDQQCLYYGFDPQYSRPDWMIWSVMPVPPMHTRLILGVAFNNKPSMDDLTVALNTNIVKVNNELEGIIAEMREKEKTEEEIFANPELITKWDLLQNCINQYINNESMSIKLQQKNGRPMKSITERIKTKKGLVRNNLEGKRVNESARTVITCDPDLDIDQVGIPIKVAMGLTFPEVVNRYNIHMLRRMVEAGPNEYPGARSIKCIRDGKTFALFNESDRKKKASALQYGDVVNRHLLDNDLIMLNRQPSLHRMNIMAHRVKVLNYDTFRINPNVTTPYNADFDGDEMNIFCVTNYMQLAELKYLMHVSTQIISPQINTPIIGTVQDSTLAPYLFTTKYAGGLTPRQMIRALSAAFTNDFSVLNLNRDYQNAQFDTKTILSMLFPEHFAYDSKNLKIINGLVQNDEPKIDKSNLVAGNYNTLFHQAFNTLGAMTTNRLFNEFAKFANEYFIQTGFTTSIKDCFPPTDNFLGDIKSKINTYDDYISKILWLISDVPVANRIEELNKMNIQDNLKNTWKDFLIHNNTEINEMYPGFVQRLWNSFAKEVEGKVFESYQNSENNGLYQMIVSGSKGSKKNLTAIIGLLGQQDVDGHWVLEEMNHRTLPHFAKDTNTPYAHGFIKNNYYSGLDPVEYYFQAIAGRFAQMLKSIKTADTGYFQRCFIKMLENVYSAHDNTIRNSFGSVIEYLYGGDGFNVYNLMKVDISDLKLWRKIEDFEQQLTNEKLNDEEKKILINLYRTIHNYFLESGKIPNSIMLPLNIKQIIANARKSNMEFKNSYSKLDSTHVRRYLTDFIKNMTSTFFIDTIFFYKLNIILFSTLYYLRTSVSDEFANFVPIIIGEIEHNIRKSLIKPTENIGVIAAQSIGQPTTQMSLNAFHNSGRSTTVTGGVPRLKELVRLSSKIATPSMTIYLKNNLNLPKAEGEKQNLQSANIMKSRISEITINKVLHHVNLSYCNSAENLTGIGKKLWDTKVGNDLPNSFYYIEMVFDKFDLLYNNMYMYNVDVIIQQFLHDNPNVNTITNWLYEDSNGYYGIFMKIDYTQEDENPNIITSSTIINTLGVISYINTVIEDIKKLTLGGIKGINYGEIDTLANMQFVIRDDEILSRDTDEQKYTTELNSHDYQEYKVLTTGTNLVEIMSKVKNVDTYKTITNDVNEVFMLMGIEAARNALIHEINIVMNQDNSDVIDRRHLQLLVDMMTHQGFLISMDRHGMFKSTSGPLQRASFEETAKQLMTASVFNEIDTMNSISDNIMFGQCIPTGTGSCSLQLNIEKFANLFTEDQDDVIGVDKAKWGKFNITFKHFLNPNL